MSIASEITRLQGVKSNILQAISDKGVTVPAGSALDDCPDLIASISGGGMPKIVSISATTDIVVVDKNGYIGDKCPNVNTVYYGYLDSLADYSQSGLGQVTIIPVVTGKVTIGGREYNTTKIGNQEWLAENLDLKIEGYTPGTWNAGSISFGYWRDDEVTYGIDGTYKCGLLYNGFAVDYLQANKDSLFPGWRVPTKADLDLLINIAQATRLKAQDRTITSSWPLNWNGMDSLRLNIIPCGTRYNGSYGYFGTVCDVWSITDSNSSNKWGLEFTQNGASEYNNFGYRNGYSVRLVRTLT